jgi:hypothetical protein
VPHKSLSNDLEGTKPFKAVSVASRSADKNMRGTKASRAICMVCLADNKMLHEEEYALIAG